METQETKIRRGQAYNLAIHDAVHNSRETDVTYIYKRYIYYHTLADIVQGSDMVMIQEVINSVNFDDVIEKLKESMK